MHPDDQFSDNMVDEAKRLMREDQERKADEEQAQKDED